MKNQCYIVMKKSNKKFGFQINMPTRTMTKYFKTSEMRNKFANIYESMVHTEQGLFKYFDYQAKSMSDARWFLNQINVIADHYYHVVSHPGGKLCKDKIGTYKENNNMVETFVGE